MNVLLVLVGGALVRITLDGTYLRYVKPEAGPLVLAAGLVIVGLALVAILRAVSLRDPLAARPIGDHHRHGTRPVWLLLLPILTIFLIAPPALGADTVLRAGNRVAPTLTAPPAALPPLPRTGVVPMAMSDFITRTVWDSGTIAGRAVTLTGFVVHANGSDYVARLVITCCAADATPMKVHLTGTAAEPLPDNQWVRLTARLTRDSATQANGYTPTVEVIALTTIPAPTDPYEH